MSQNRSNTLISEFKYALNSLDQALVNNAWKNTELHTAVRQLKRSDCLVLLRDVVNDADINDVNFVFLKKFISNINDIEHKSVIDQVIKELKRYLWGKEDSKVSPKLAYLNEVSLKLRNLILNIKSGMKRAAEQEPSLQKPKKKQRSFSPDSSSASTDSGIENEFNLNMSGSWPMFFYDDMVVSNEVGFEYEQNSFYHVDKNEMNSHESAAIVDDQTPLQVKQAMDPIDAFLTGSQEGTSSQDDPFANDMDALMKFQNDPYHEDFYLDNEVGVFRLNKF